MTSPKRNNAEMRSAARHTLAEVVDFSPAPAQARNEEAGRKTKSSRTGGIGPTAVVKPPLSTGGGGGGGVMSTGGEEARNLSAGMPQSAEFSPAPASEQHRQAGRRTMPIGTSGIKPTQVEKLPLSKAGGGGGVRFTAMAEVHRPPSTEDEGEVLAQPSGQQVIGNTYPGRTPVMSSAPREDTLFSGPEMHPAQMRVLDGIHMEEVECLEPLLISVPESPLDSKPMAGNRMRNSSDVAISQKDMTG